MAAPKSNLKSVITDITICSICLNRMENPRSLPCLHTFCLKCVEGFCKAKPAGSKVLCPQCRKEFQIPQKGVSELPHNFMIANLILVNKREEYCLKHEDEVVKKYCCKCEVQMCSVCEVLEHQGHECQRVEDAMKKIFNQIDMDGQRVQSRFSNFQKEMTRLKEMKQRFIEKIQTVETEIRKTGDEIKKLVDSHVEHLVKELYNVRVNGVKDIHSATFKLNISLFEMEKFAAAVRQTKTQEKLSAISEAAKQLHVHAEKLLKSHHLPNPLPSSGHPPDVTFEPATAHFSIPSDGSPCTTSLVGKIGVQDFGIKRKADKSPTAPPPRSRAKQSEPSAGPSTKPTGMPNFNFGNQRWFGNQSKKPDFFFGKKADQANPILGHFGISWKIEHKLPVMMGEPVRGMTTLDNKLYILYRRQDNQIDIHATDHFAFIRHLSVPGLVDTEDMTSCQRDNCLYISDRGGKCIHRVEPEGASIQWPCPHVPAGLSVTEANSLVVSCPEASKLLMYTTDGELIQEVALELPMVSPWHAVKIEPSFQSRFSVIEMMICYGVNATSVCSLTHAEIFAADSESKDASAVAVSSLKHISDPCHISMYDLCGRHVLVADRASKRLMIVRIVDMHTVSKCATDWYPCRVSYDIVRKRLYVAENEHEDRDVTNGRVVVMTVQGIF